MSLSKLTLAVANFLGIVKTELIPSMDETRRLMENLRTQYNPDNFVETGTFWGDTIEFFKHNYTRLYSIELSEDLYARARKRFEPDQQVEILHGDSGKIFNE